MPSIYMLDTDTCSYTIKQNPISVVQAFWKHKNDEICISSVTYGELMYGAIRAGSLKIQAAIRQFLTHVDLVDFDTVAADEYARIRCALEAQGTPIAIADLMIASCARAKGAVLVTNNVQHFARISELKVENWIAFE